MVDTHCHLDMCEPPVAELLASARARGVTRLASVGIDPASVERTLAIAREHPEVAAIVGRHPNQATGFTPADLAAIERVAAAPEVRAIGETGLDYYRDGAPRPDQRRAFELQIDLAARLNLPVVIHTRAAEEDTFAILRERAAGVRVVLHCFTAAGRVAEAVEHGYMCSFAGNVTYPKATDLHEAAATVPDELLLVETDSPFLSPQPVRRKPNEPANVVSTAQWVAELRGVSYAELELLVEGNAQALFGW